MVINDKIHAFLFETLELDNKERSRNMKNTILIFTLILFGGTGCATGMKQELSKSIVELQCSDVGNIKSIEGTVKYKIDFVNSRDESVDMFWINYEGQEELKQTMLPGDSWGVNTYATHPWLVRDKSGDCLALYNSRSSVVVEIN